MKKEILIVEDGRADEDLLKKVLSNSGFLVSSAECLKTAQEKLKINTPDYILRKLDSQDSEGMDLCQCTLDLNRHKEGAEKYQSLNENGPLPSYCVFQNVTDKIKQLEALKASEEKFNAITDQSSEGIGVTDINGKYSYVNTAFSEMVGWSKEELLNMTVFDLIADKKDEEVFNRTITTEEGSPVSVELLRKDGAKIFIEVVAKGIQVSGEKIFLGTVRDITKKKKVEEDLKLSEEKYRLMATNTLDAIWTIDLEFNVTFISDVILNFLGYTRDEFIGLNASVFTAPEDVPGMLEVSEILRKMYSNGERAQIVREIRQIKKDGSIIDVEMTASLLLDKDRNVIGYQGRSIDISQRKKTEDNLRIALIDLNALKDKIESEKKYLQEEIKQQHNFTEMIGESKVMRKMFKQIELVAATDSAVLILGETGTGKELVARAIQSLSKREKHTLVKVNCPALPVDLIESELFGHEKGAFTGALTQKLGRFELADKGTIFLDEIGDFPAGLQAKLLRVLQEGEFERVGGVKTIKINVRIIAATNRDLEQLVLRGEFRQDLYFRLNVFPITAPSLRERKEDIPQLVNYFVKKFNPKMGKNISIIPPRLIEKLMDYSWPGNVRELENVIERSMIFNQNSILDVGEWFKVDTDAKSIANGRTLKTIEKNHICQILEETKWRIRGDKGAAVILGINPTTLESRMKKLNVRRPKFTEDIDKLRNIE